MENLWEIIWKIWDTYQIYGKYIKIYGKRMEVSPRMGVPQARWTVYTGQSYMKNHENGLRVPLFETSMSWLIGRNLNLS